MSERTLNLGILAHVDAGKTTLTERLLYEAGVIDAVGSVDKGTTQTDSLDLERQRGITIKSAVVSFAIGDVTVNLIDTPGHPDFVAEVERVLGVLDGVVLVISAVEGVQSQTLVLMRALQRLRIPTLLFVNKTDRAGADPARVLQEIRERLTPAAVPVGAGLAEALAEHDDAILMAFVGEEPIAERRLWEALAAHTSACRVHPAFVGSARTGDGVVPLMAGIAELLPAAAGEPDSPVAGRVFKIEHRAAYVRMLTGTVHTRDRVRFGDGLDAKVTAIEVFHDGTATQRDCVCAGEIARVRGLAGIRIGDALGDCTTDGPGRQFVPPTLEAGVVADEPAERKALQVALAELAEQDPLIDVHRDAEGELSVSLYGEVQKEVIEATLRADYGLAVTFRETAAIHVERPAGAGEAVEVLNTESNPYRATIGLRIEPAPDGSGFEFRLAVAPLVVPLYVYKRLESFAEHMEGYVREALRSGLYGWEVTDCVVTMTRCMYSVPDGPPSRNGPLSTAADFRKLTPLVLAQALEHAGTVVCEPVVLARIEVAPASLGAVIALLGSSLRTQSPDAVEAVIPAARVHHVQQRLTALTRGEALLETTFAGYRPVTGEPPARRPALVAGR